MDETAMVRSMAARMQALALDGVRLCVYPGLWGLSLAGPWPADLAWQNTVRAHPGLRHAFMSVASRAARNAHMYLVPGSVLVPEGDLFAEWSGLFSPTGDLVGEQLATQPDPACPELVLGRQLRPLETPFGPVGLLVGRDSEVPEVGRILTLQGARLLVAPRAPRAPYSAMDAMSGLWEVVQQNQVFGLESGLAGTAAGHVRDGKAAALAPSELSPGQSGFLGRPGYYVGDDVLTADLDYELLEELRQRRPLARHLNAALYRRHPEVFGAAPAPAADPGEVAGGV